ncbi:hypothetical protein JWG39_03585 [Desulforhopalus vacuolatus]|uniref:hypothetical protein n=1 Tax=Desulforhopalus vacuolatus TaxID=40414 RepID=UPI001966C826|nr:hypothetical protein [Desulforhopalus vacuolatus]MBM9518896.1 hypothetical protein [Desulforhopalus vacuolatus]
MRNNQKESARAYLNKKNNRLKHFSTYFFSIAFIVLLLAGTTQAQPQRKYIWEDLAHHTSGEDIFRIAIITDSQNPCDCERKGYKVHYYSVEGDAAFQWLKQKGLAKKSADGTWIQTDIYRSWKSYRDNKKLYWQKCQKYCENLKQEKNKNVPGEVKGFWKVGPVGGSFSGSINLTYDKSQHDRSRFEARCIGGRCPFSSDVKMWERQGSSVIIFRNIGREEIARVKYIRKGYWEGTAKRRNSKGYLQIYMKK